MPRTSNKAQLIVDYVNQFIQENGYSPSVREIGAAVGLRSTASVSYHLQALQEKGLLQSPGSKGRKRAIVTTVRPGQIPVVGVVTAGLPILAVTFQSIERISSPCKYSRTPAKSIPCPLNIEEKLPCRKPSAMERALRRKEAALFARVLLSDINNDSFFIKNLKN